MKNIYAILTVILLVFTASFSYAADAKISALTEVTSPASTDVIPVVSSSTTKKLQILNLFGTFAGPVAGSTGTFSSAVSGTTGTFSSSLTGKIAGSAIVSTPTVPDFVGRLYTTTGASGTITFNLPTVTLGDRASFCVTAQQIILNPNGSERFLEVTDANGDSITLPAIEGCCVTVIGISAGKMVTALWGVETSCTITDSN